jgi:hypothetical protein
LHENHLLYPNSRLYQRRKGQRGAPYHSTRPLLAAQLSDQIMIRA